MKEPAPLVGSHASIRAELARVSFFGNLSEAELDSLAGLAARRSYPSGKVLFFQDDQSDSLYVLLSGSAKIYQTSEDGLEKILKVIRAGDIVGEFALIEGNPRSATVEAVEPSEALVLERRPFQAFMLAHPEALWKVATSLCARVRELGEETMELSYREVPYRLLRKILELAEKTGEPTERGVRIKASIGLADLASMVGTNRETVRRYLQRFAEERLVLLEGQTLIVPSLQTAGKALEYVADWY